MKTVGVVNRNASARMIHQIPKVLSKTKAQTIGKLIAKREFTEPLIEPLVHRVSSIVDISLAHPAYAKVEHKHDGHPWHTDTGNQQHMSWCRWTATVLLTDTFEGGELFFRNLKGPVDNYLNLLIYSSDEEHRVNPHEGDRHVLLMFFT